jgi:hypothetical protein
MIEWRVVLNIVGATLGFLGFGAGGCGFFGGQCSCPAPGDSVVIAVIPLACEPPVVKTTGPCFAALAGFADQNDNSQDLLLTANGAGTCHVEVTFGSGATSSLDVDFVSAWAACGSDPHGCGEGFGPANAAGSPSIQASVPACDAGLSCPRSCADQTSAGLKPNRAGVVYDPFCKTYTQCFDAGSPPSDAGLDAEAPD